MFLKNKNKNKKDFLYADSAFLDSKNLADFDSDKFEGVLEKSLDKKVFLWMIILIFFIMMFFLWKTFSFQIIHGQEYLQKSLSNFTRSAVVFSERGVVFDRNGKELIWNTKNENESFSKRSYIDKLGFSHILGFLSYPQRDKSKKYFEKEYVGKGGIEKYFNDVLNGKVGEIKIEVDSHGNIISDNIIRESEHGQNITLSIDVNVQYTIAVALENYLIKHSFIGGAASVIDVENGEIIAMVSLPEYSSTILTEGKDQNQIKVYLDDKSNPFLNKVTYGEFTPGSVIKPFIAMAALKNNIITAKEKVYTNGSIIIPNKYNPANPSIFRDWKNQGIVDLNKAIAQSSNVYFYILGGGIYGGKKGLGIDILEKNFLSFGLGEKTGIQLFAEKQGQIPNPTWKEKAFKDARPWGIGNTYYTSIGQFGFQLTPMQVLVATASLANRGVILKPKVIKGEKREIKRIVNFSEQTFADVKRAMRETVLSGTSQTLNFNFIKIAAKTGTAQIKKNTRENSWVAGFFPYENPKYAFVFLAEDGPIETISGISNATREFFLKMKEEEWGKKYLK